MGQRFAYRYEPLRALLARPKYWVLFSGPIAIDESSRISLTRPEELADTPTANWNMQWPFPEVALRKAGHRRDRDVDRPPNYRDGTVVGAK